MYDDSMLVLALSAAAFFTCITGFIIYFVVLYRNKQVNNEREKEQLQSAFRHEILKTQVEMQEQTLAHISREIHDNITQVLSFVKLTLAMINRTKEGERQSKIDESRELIAQSITDLRDLSKSLSFEHISSMGLLQVIETEIARINKSGLVEVSFSLEGDAYSLGAERELVLFRVFQEALNNSFKHSGARHLKINLQYHSDLFNLSLQDDGSGFSAETLDNKSGTGLKNIQNRAALIGGTATIDSSPGKGCCVKVTLNPFKQQFYTDGGPHPDRFS